MRTDPVQWNRVSGRSGGLLKAKRQWCASEEAARNEQTPEPQHHALSQGSHSGARDLAFTKAPAERNSCGLPRTMNGTRTGEGTPKRE
ncbi:MAG: hypothetical protein KF797_05635 [Flavobacteriales bacterium]|nr:hypothetical protein [Flavobacteriales bacterium]